MQEVEEPKAGSFVSGYNWPKIALVSGLSIFTWIQLKKIVFKTKKKK